MNSLEAEYSFLAPTWRLPSVATTSMYPRTYGSSYLSSGADLNRDWSLWDNTRYNSRYIPSYVPPSTMHRNYLLSTDHQRIVPPIIPSQQQHHQAPGALPAQPNSSYYQQTNIQYGKNTNPEDGLNLTISLHPNNGYESHNSAPNYGQPKQQTMNRGLTYATHSQNNPPPPAQKRRVQIIDHSRHTPPSTVNNDYMSDRSSHNSNTVHSYSHFTRHTPDSTKPQHKSKPSAPNQHRDHHDDNKSRNNGHNHNIHEYLYGLSTPDPGSYVDAFKHQQRRLQDEKVGRKSVMSDYRNFAQNGGFGPTFGNAEQQTHGDKISTEKKKKTYSQVVRETNHYKIEEHKRVQSNNGQQKNRNAPIPKNQRSDAEFSSIIITPLSSNQRRSSLDSIQSLTPFDSLSNEFILNRPRRSSSLSSIITKRRVRFRSRDFIRRRSSTLIDLPSPVIGKNIPRQQDSLSARFNTQKPTPKSLDEKDHKHLNLSLQPPPHQDEKKFITSHSMTMTRNMKLPPTATVIINQTHTPSLMTRTSTNKTSKKDIISSQRLITIHSIPDSVRQTSQIIKPDFDLKIKSFHHNHDKNSSNE